VLNTFLEAGWPAVALSRRRPEPDSPRPFKHLAFDLGDATACADAVRDLDVSHVVYAAVYEQPGLVSGWSDPVQMQTNLRMLRNVLDPLSTGGRLRHVTIMQGTKAYGAHLHPIPLPARESAARDDHPNFYWLQEDYLKAKAIEADFGWTIFRPVQVVGPAYRSAYSVPVVMGVYSALCHVEGRPFAFPGGKVFPARQIVDARLVGSAARWAATAEAARGEHFNLTNGEVFSWPQIWTVVGRLLGHEPAPPSSLSLAEFLPSRAQIWARIVEQHKLRPLPLGELLGQSHFYADYTFGFGARTTTPPALVSTIKVKQAGFGDVMNTDESVTHAIRRLIERQILPHVNGAG
jgi:nucleoside-diphosphate-sugar epimerase